MDALFKDLFGGKKAESAPALSDDGIQSRHCVFAVRISMTDSFDQVSPILLELQILHPLALSLNLLAAYPHLLLPSRQVHTKQDRTQNGIEYGNVLNHLIFMPK